MRTVVRAAIVADATLQGLGVAVDGSNVLAGDIDTPTARPFLQLRWGEGMPGVGEGARRHDKRSLTIWVHDTPGDYARIDSIIARLKVVLYGISAVTYAGGAISVIDWISDSDDLSDDGHETISRNTTYFIAASGM